MNSWKVILATIVIYGAGVMTGGLLVNHVDHQNAPRRELSRPRAPEIWRREFVSHLDKALKLTPEQHAAIQRIVRDGQNSMHRTMQETRLKIRAQLTPEQQRKFDELWRHPPHRQAGSTNASPHKSPAPVRTNAPGA